MTTDLREPGAFRRAFDDHHRKVYSAAYGVLGDAALAQDVVQDVFLRLWKRPTAFDPSRGDLGAYLRLMGRSRALDLWRETQVRTRAADKLKLVGGNEEPRADEQPEIVAYRHEETDEVREALEAPRSAARGARARLQGRPHRGPDRVPRAHPPSAPPRAGSGFRARPSAGRVRRRSVRPLRMGGLWLKRFRAPLSTERSFGIAEP